MNNTIIKAWMRQTVKDGTWQKYDDLHIDVVDRRYSRPEMWVVGGLKVLEVAVTYRDEMEFPFVVALGFSLVSTQDPTPGEFQTLQDITQKLDLSPPSLYLFKPEWNEWLETKSRGIVLSVPEIRLPKAIAFYLESYNSEDLEWRHSIFVYSQPTKVQGPG